MAAILNFEKFFEFFFSKGTTRPQRDHCVKIWRPYVKRSSRYAWNKHTNTQTHKHSHKVNNRKNLFQQSWLLHTLIMKWLLRFPIKTELAFTFKILIEQAICSKNQTLCVLLLDMSRAFDTIDRGILLKDLKTLLNQISFTS